MTYNPSDEARERWQEIIDNNRLGVDWEAHDDSAMTGRWALVMSSHYLGGGEWLSSHLTPEDAGVYAVELKADFEPYQLIDLELGDVYEPQLMFVFVDPDTRKPIDSTETTEDVT